MNQEVDYTIETASDEPMSFSRRKNRRQDAEMDITPMIDITFLLLIFFLVASHLTEEAFIKLPTAQHGSSVSNESSAIVTLAKGNGDNAIIYKGDGAFEETKIELASVEDQQTELERYLESELTVGSKQQVLIKAEQGVRHRDVARVARAAGNATATVLYVAVLEER